MAKHPKQDDYAGNAILRKGRRKRYRAKGQRHSFRCDSCGTIRYVLPIELGRATKPRCLACGGLLLETKEEERRHKEERKRVCPTNAYRCKCCGAALGTFAPSSLSAHLETRADCLKYFVDEGYILSCGAIFGTLEIIRGSGNKKWLVVGVGADGIRVTLIRFATRYRASDWIGSQEQTRKTLSWRERR